MNKPVSITIKLVIFAALASLGIMYILEKSPVSEVSNYKKEEIKRTYSSGSSSSFFSSQPDADSDAVSITGSSGHYDEVRIGSSYQSEQEPEE